MEQYSSTAEAKLVLTYEGIRNGLPVLQLEVAQVICFVIRHIDDTGSCRVKFSKQSSSLSIL